MIIDCKAIKANEIKKLKTQFAKLENKPKLKIFMIGDNQASTVYVKNKVIVGEQVGVDVCVENLKTSISEEQLLAKIDEANEDPKISGLFVQLPVPKHISEDAIINRIASSKDVDGFSNVNSGKLMAGHKTLNPCTADAVISILENSNVELSGANVVVAGRSNIVGKPLANLLINKGATVTVCNSQTRDIKSFIDNADVFISAIGSANYFDQSYFSNSDNLTVIDVGINRNQEGKLCGDIDTLNVEPLVKQITSVPGGVGVLTVVHVMKNILKAVKKEN